MSGAARDACALVLAGGQSRRFGSDKALAQFRGQPLLAHVLRGVQAAGFAQIALAAKEPQRYAAVGGEISSLTHAQIELVPDIHPFQAPLSGVHAGLSAARHELVFACAADMPFAADPALIDALFAAIAGHDAAVPEAGGSLQPLCALWRRAPCLAAAEQLLAAPRPAGPPPILAPVPAAKLDSAGIRPFLHPDPPHVLRD